jgi:hypothetical protein
MVFTMRALFTSVAILLLLMRAGAAPTADTVTLAVDGRSNATPWIAASGPFVAVAWGATSAGRADVFAAVSRDGGRTFSAPVQVNAQAGEARLGGEFPPRVAMAPNRGTRMPDIVVLWTARLPRRSEAEADLTQIKTSRSRDGGRTFEPPIALQAAGAVGDRGWPAMVVDQSGLPHAIWLDHRGLAKGRTPGGAHAGHQSGAAHDGAAMALKSGVYYSVAGERATERELAAGVCYCCKTALASGPDGSIYAAWRHVYAGDLRDIAFTQSRDGGKSFAPPVRVSEDGWSIKGCPDNGPAIAVDSRGTVHLAWPSVIDGPTPEGALFYASTRDGRSFTPRTRIPRLGPPGVSHPQIVVDPRGRVVVAWDERVEGSRVVAAREVKLQIEGSVAFGEATVLSSAGIYPVLAATADGLIGAWVTGGDASRIEVRRIRLP